MDKNGVITISDWQKGIAVSPLSGFADVRNCDIHNPDGILKIALAPTKISSTTVTEVPTWMTDSKTDQSYYFGGYRDVNVYKFNYTTRTVTTTSNSGFFSPGTLGGYFYKNYLIAINGNDSGTSKLMAYKPSNDTWNLTVGTLNTVPARTVCPMLWTQDDNLYFGNAQYLGRIGQQGSTTFNPMGTASVDYSFTNNALDIRTGFIIESLAELSAKLYVGASQYLSGTKQYTYNGRIFPWDLSSPSFTFPIILDRGAVRQMISRNGNILFANGTRGQYLSTNGTFTQEAPVIGELRKNDLTSNGVVFPNAKALVNGEYLFGISTNDTTFTPAGIYGLKDGTWRFLEISTGEVGANNSLEIGVIYPRDDISFYVGWYDAQNSAYGIDEFGYSSYRYTGYRARVDSQLYSVATSIQKKQFTEIEFTLAKPLATGQGIKLSYRTNLNDNFTPIGTYDYSTLGAITEYNAPASILSTDKVQIRIELTTGASSTTSPELIAVRLK